MPRIVMLHLAVPDRIDHLPGQHYVVRLTAPDGYTAARSYSVSSAPSDPLLELCIERLDDGEVSGYLADVVELGDKLDVRGPIGGWFVWQGRTPAIAIGGGTGVVPLVAMHRHAVDLGTTSLLRLAVSGRTPAELPYADELMAAGARVAWTRGPSGRRLMPDDLAPLIVDGRRLLRLRIGRICRGDEPDIGNPRRAGLRNQGRAVRPQRVNEVLAAPPGGTASTRPAVSTCRNSKGGSGGSPLVAATQVALVSSATVSIRSSRPCPTSQLMREI